ncbi:hypothetical protein BDZ97DRAFT_1225851 [Flammula alnicola]|nr:hypothetical protein BDZ97DRAFT_1225851 [Flammula alnicola]
MVDPLSVTLSVITLATALKDIIELGQKIKDSFAKVSQNLRNVQELAGEIVGTLQQLWEFCDRHYAVLNASDEMKAALRKLRKDMDSVYASCCKLIPPSSEKLVGRVKIAFYSFKNRNRVEELITKLRNHVNKCREQFMLFALMRIEVSLAALRHSNAEGLSMVRREISMMRVSDMRSCAFMESSSTAISKRPSGHPEPNIIISDAMYLGQQINAINESLTRLSAMHFQFPKEHTAGYTLPYQPLLVTSVLPRDRNALQRYVVTRALEIQTFLQDDLSTLSIQDGAREMLNFTVGLCDLGMYEEAATMGLWTVRLFRTLADVYPEIYKPHVFQSFQHLSTVYRESGNLEKAYKVMEECTKAFRGRQTFSLPVQLKVQFGGILTTHAMLLSLKTWHDQSLDVAEEAIKVFEDIFQMPVPPYQSKEENLLEANPDFPRKLSLAGMTDRAVCDYARAIRQLSNSLQNVGRLQDSIAPKFTALAIFRDLCRLDPKSALEVELASILLDMNEHVLRPFIPRERVLSLIDEALEIYRRNAQWNPSRFGQPLCTALFSKAYLLAEMERYGEAVDVWSETIESTKKLVVDQLYLAEVLGGVCWSLRSLKRHDEAATMRLKSVMAYQSVLGTTSETQANGYYDLSVDLQLAGRFEEAIQAAQNSVKQFRMRALKHGSKWHIGSIARSLTALAKACTYAGAPYSS